MVSVSYKAVWKWIAIDWDEWFTFYWKDFNPTVWTIPSWNTFQASDQTSWFDLSWFQPWHEVWCYVANLSVSWVSWQLDTYNRLQARINWSWTTVWTFPYSDYVSGVNTWAWYMYFWVDYDEIWSYATNYRINMEWHLDWESWEENTPFTIMNLDIDSTRHDSWYLWVEWSHLCYTDASWSSSRWYKHKIAYDSWYSEYVWTSKAWAIWLRPWDNTRICYVDANWYSRRTYSSDAWYGWNTNVWSSNAWYMWVSDWDEEDGYAHLCFIAPNWSKRRILNWPVE